MQEIVNEKMTFPEVWGSLEKDQKEAVTRQLIVDGWTLSRQTVWNWGTGKWKPRTSAIRKGVTNSINKALGVKYLSTNLFPA